MRRTMKNKFFPYILIKYDVLLGSQADQTSMDRGLIYGIEQDSYIVEPIIYGSAINYFGELEDVLEKYEIESPEELDRVLGEKYNRNKQI